MKSRTLALKRVGQIEHADVQFGDLTILVGPQATGKSIFLQFFKLVKDSGIIRATFMKNGLDWKRDTSQFLDAYLGEGMRGVWRSSESEIIYNGSTIDLQDIVSGKKRSSKETVFYIPAQRVLTATRGWPRPFTDFSPGDPFVVRDFSEKIRRMVESEWFGQENLFPQPRRLKSEIRDLLNQTVFRSFSLQVDRYGPQKRLVLKPSAAAESLPVMVWSAGQREFVPLLLGFYWLLPPTKVSRRAEIEWVVIEELEMGLHPKAITAVLLLVLELLSRDYRVCLSTHSPHVLDVVWAMKVLREHNAHPERLLDLFQAEASSKMKAMAVKVLEKTARVYYFDPNSGSAQDISNLDPGAADAAEAGWGGLVEFSGRVTNLVGEIVSEAENQ